MWNRIFLLPCFVLGILRVVKSIKINNETELNDLTQIETIEIGEFLIVGQNDTDYDEESLLELSLNGTPTSNSTDEEGNLTY